MRFGYGRLGKRGGGRTIYYLFSGELIGLITAYAKADKIDVTAAEVRQFLALIEDLSDD
ncbi:MAG TPA: hypothetical protein VII63_04680 [Caulobacteraceae bacterium]